MKNAKIFHVESDPAFRTMVEVGLAETSDSRHQVVASAGTASEADSVLDSVQQGELDVNTLLLSDEISHQPDGLDVVTVSMEVQRRELVFRTIGLGNIRISGAYGIETDRQYKKDEFDLSKFAVDLDYLREPELPEEIAKRHELQLLKTFGLTPKIARQYLADRYGGVTPEELRATNPIAHGSHDLEAFIRIALGEEPAYLLERVYEEVRAEDDERQAQKERDKGNMNWRPSIGSVAATEYRASNFRDISKKLRDDYPELC